MDTHTHTHTHKSEEYIRQFHSVHLADIKIKDNHTKQYLPKYKKHLKYSSIKILKFTECLDTFGVAVMAFVTLNSLQLTVRLLFLTSLIFL